MCRDFHFDHKRGKVGELALYHLFKSLGYNVFHDGSQNAPDISIFWGDNISTSERKDWTLYESKAEYRYAGYVRKRDNVVLKATGNFFIECYGKKGELKGPWEAKRNGYDFYCFFVNKLNVLFMMRTQAVINFCNELETTDLIATRKSESSGYKGYITKPQVLDAYLDDYPAADKIIAQYDESSKTWFLCDNWHDVQRPDYLKKAENRPYDDESDEAEESSAA